MTRRLMAALLALAFAAMAAPANAQTSCDRTCLAGKLDQFLKAVVARDPAKANLWIGVRETQNALLSAPGEGIWKTNTGIGSLDRRYYDPDTQQAEFYGTIKEGKDTAIVSLRMKLHGAEIGEAEWHIARAGDPDIMGTKERTSFNVQNLLNDPPQQRVVPEAQRRPRDELIAAVNSYFDGITAGSGRHVQANAGCMRLENGMGAPPGYKLGPDDAAFESKPDCRSGYAGLGIVDVAARRYLMVDEEAQVVVASAVFMRHALNPKRRNSFMEIFFMDGGKISKVYAAMVYAAPTTPVPNWPPYDGNFPIGQNLVLHN